MTMIIFLHDVFLLGLLATLLFLNGIAMICGRSHIAGNVVLASIYARKP